MHVAMACFRYNISVHDVTGLTPFEAMFGVRAFDFDARVGWKTVMDENDERSFPKQMDDMHAELFRRGSSARGRAARQYIKAVREVEFEKGQSVLLF